MDGRLTTKDLYEQGYFLSANDMCRKVGLTKQTIRFWINNEGGIIPEKWAERIISASRKPLSVSMLSTRRHAAEGRPKLNKKTKEVKQVMAVRVKDSKLSSWVVSMAERGWY